MSNAPMCRVVVQPTEEVLKLVGYWERLEEVYKMVQFAQQQVEQAIGVPVCVESCRGLCCRMNSIAAYGVEAEHVASWLLTQGKLLPDILDRARGWLTAPGNWTYGRKLNYGIWKSLEMELREALMEPCCFLSDEGRCLIHEVRPLVCRTYGVLHMPGSNCPRPLGFGEDENSRAWFDAKDPSLPIRLRWNSLRWSMKEPRFNRGGFLAMMLFERFHAKELAGLMDDGRIPLVKAHEGHGRGLALLWQDDLEREWRNVKADISIAGAVPLRYREGVPRMVVGKPELVL